VNGFDEEMVDYCYVADWRALGNRALFFHGEFTVRCSPFGYSLYWNAFPLFF